MVDWLQSRGRRKSGEYDANGTAASEEWRMARKVRSQDAKIEEGSFASLRMTDFCGVRETQDKIRTLEHRRVRHPTKRDPSLRSG
jgi:hypothetical protein